MWIWREEREVSTENVWYKQVKEHLEILRENGYKKASVHGSPPGSGVARKGANLHHKHGAGPRGTGRTLVSGAGLCALA